MTQSKGTLDKINIWIRLCQLTQASAAAGTLDETHEERLKLWESYNKKEYNNGTSDYKRTS